MGTGLLDAFVVGIVEWRNGSEPATLDRRSFGRLRPAHGD